MILLADNPTILVISTVVIQYGFVIQVRMVIVIVFYVMLLKLRSLGANLKIGDVPLIRCNFLTNLFIIMDLIKDLEEKHNVDLVVQQRKKKVHILPKSREWKIICWIDEFGFPHSESKTVDVVNANVDPNNLSRKLTKFDNWFRDNYRAIFNHNL